LSDERLPPAPIAADDEGPSGLLDLRLSRRRFLFVAAATVGTVTLASVVPGTSFLAEVASYEGVKVGTISGLQPGQAQEFRYPWDHANCINYLVKLGVPAGGGVGPDQDIVGFNTICPHMGMPMVGTFNAQHQVLGPCPLHLSTYDLTRHGIVVAGHATQGLPQILLETRGDDIYAVGVMALIYGFSDNEVAPRQT